MITSQVTAVYNLALYLRSGLAAPVPSIPTLIVIVEAKSGKTVDNLSSEAEAIGGLLLLSVHE